MDVKSIKEYMIKRTERILKSISLRCFFRTKNARREYERTQGQTVRSYFFIEKGCDKRIINFKDYKVNSKGHVVFISEYENICDDMNYNPVTNGYRLYLRNYGESFRILSFKVIVTSLYGISTVQCFNISMMKSRTIECRCTLEPYI